MMEEYMKEIEGKRVHDYDAQMVKTTMDKRRLVWVRGPVIVGAGPSGLACAACLKHKGIPSLILERSHCLASMWEFKTYDRLRLHLPKQFCQLPLLPFPKDFPSYPTKQQFLAYLKAYALHFSIKPAFNNTVISAEFDHRFGLWRVKTNQQEFICQWLIVATGENAEAIVPQIEGMGDFLGPVLHSSSYKRGSEFSGKKVLVVGCGNSGMEVCLDLCDHNAHPSLVVRDTVSSYTHSQTHYFFVVYASRIPGQPFVIRNSTGLRLI